MEEFASKMGARSLLKKLPYALLLTYALVITIWMFNHQSCNTNYQCKPCKADEHEATKLIRMNKELKETIDTVRVKLKDCVSQAAQWNSRIRQLNDQHTKDILAWQKSEIVLRDKIIALNEKLNSGIIGIDKHIKEIEVMGQKTYEEITKINGKKFDPFLGKKIVHLDFKGAPPKMFTLLEMIRNIKGMGATGLLLEYEDMLPWRDNLEKTARSIHYKEDEIQLIQKTADDNELEIIPMIPSITYIDFVLKSPEFVRLREHKESTHILDITKLDSLQLIKEMINQVMELHPKSKYIHLGGSYHNRYFKNCHRCKITEPPPKVKSFMINLFKYVSTFGARALIWDNAMRHWSVDELKEYSPHVTPMVKSTLKKVTEDFPKDLWDRYDEAFETIWIASAYKGTHRPWTNRVRINDHIDNTLSWLEVLQNLKAKNLKVEGIALLGRNRYNHYAPLCELFPVAIPTLQTCFTILREGKFTNDLHKSISTSLKFTHPIRLHPEFKHKFKIEKPGYSGGNIYQLVQQLEKAVGYDEELHMKEDGWTRNYQIKHNRLYYLYINETLTDRRIAYKAVTLLLKNTRSKLSKYYFNETVDEWMADKIVYNTDFLATRVKFLEGLLNSSFP